MQCRLVQIIRSPTRGQMDMERNVFLYTSDSGGVYFAYYIGLLI